MTQSNTASSLAKAFNVNLTKQDADQEQDTSCKCHEAFGIQAIGQLNKSDQYTAALAATFQLGASNTSAPVRVTRGRTATTRATSRAGDAVDRVIPQ